MNYEYEYECYIGKYFYVPKRILATNNKCYASTKNFYAAVYGYIDGKTLIGDNYENFTVVGDLLAKLHLIAPKFRTRNYRLEDYNSLEPHLTVTSCKLHGIPEYNIILSYANYVIKNIDLNEMSYYHCNIHFNNLIRVGRKIYIIDFDDCRIEYRLIDIGLTIGFCLELFSYTPTYNDIVHGINLFLSAYIKRWSLGIKDRKLSFTPQFA